jgi:protein gp37
VADTAIQWTDRVWNPVGGCALVSEGCRNCYAMRQAHRFSGPGGTYEGLTKLTSKGPTWTGAARFVPEKLAEPLSWRKPARVFVNSMSDLFHDDVTNEQIAAVFGVMWACPQHTFQVLTKRPARALAWFRWAGMMVGSNGFTGERSAQAVDPLMSCQIQASRHGAVLGAYRLGERPSTWPLPNVWLGVSAENQEAFDERVENLMACPAAVQFLSIEPMLGPVNIERFLYRASRFDYIWHDNPMSRDDHPERQWVIVGGESGNGARPCDLAWLRSIVEQCREAGIACFVKQLGSRPQDAALRDVVCNGKRHYTRPAADPSLAEAATTPGYSVATHVLQLRDRKGGDMADWPESLRVRQFPEARP